MTRARDLADYISTGVSDTELDVLDGVTAGTVTASKALVVDANKDIATIRNITSSGTITGVTSLTVDDITLDGSTISDGGDFTLDVGGDIIFDTDGGDVFFKDGGTSIGLLKNNNSDFEMRSLVNDKDIKFSGEDGGSTIVALTLDMSEAGKATFNNEIVATRFVDSANTAYHVDPFATSVLAYSYLQQSYAFNSALSGTTPTCNAATFSSFSLTTSGNTTFTFSTNVATGYLHGFVLKLTSGGSHTITWPASVDWAGGTAPDAPASGETDILVFTTIDAGTNWYGARVIDAAA